MATLLSPSDTIYTNMMKCMGNGWVQRFGRGPTALASDKTRANLVTGQTRSDCQKEHPDRV